MKHIENIFTRMDLGQIRQFLLYGAEKVDQTKHSYIDRLEIGTNPILNRLKNLCPDKLELDGAIADLSLALNAYESVYMEVGMKGGARLICQLLLTDDSSEKLPNDTNHNGLLGNFEN